MAHRRFHLSAMCLLFSCALTSACDQRSGGATVTPSDGHGTDSELTPEGEFVGESINELDLRLQRLVERQDRQITASNFDAGECEELCELSRAICEIKTKMCEIADERVNDDDYQNLCRVAKQRCQRASQSCVRCVDHLQHAGQSSSAPPEPATCEGGSDEPVGKPVESSASSESSEPE